MPVVWEQSRAAGKSAVKCAICVPTSDNSTTIQWAFRLARLISEAGGPVALVAMKGTPIDVARNTLVRMALESNAEWVFFLDADTIPDDGVLARLLSRGLPMVSGVYYAKKYEGCWPAAWVKEGGVYKPLSDENKGLVMADAVGCGCMLVHSSVFRKIPPPWFKWETNTYSPDGKLMEKGCSEDFYMVAKAKEHGIQALVDFDCRCDHIGAFKIDMTGKVRLL